MAGERTASSLEASQVEREVVFGAPETVRLAPRQGSRSIRTTSCSVPTASRSASLTRRGRWVAGAAQLAQPVVGVVVGDVRGPGTPPPGDPDPDARVRLDVAHVV